MTLFKLMPFPEMVFCSRSSRVEISLSFTNTGKPSQQSAQYADVNSLRSEGNGQREGILSFGVLSVKRFLARSAGRTYRPLNCGGKMSSFKSRTPIDESRERSGELLWHILNGHHVCETGVLVGQF